MDYSNYWLRSSPMNMFLRGTIRSSPTKTSTPLRQPPSYSFDSSFTSDASYECCSTNPEHSLWSGCRRSPRLLTNGYYVLTEDSFVTDDQGNLTLSPAHTSISYKENLARIFPRRRKTRRSFATFLNEVSQSLLSKSIFGSDGNPSSTEASSCLTENRSIQQDACDSFTYDKTVKVPLKDRDSFLPVMDSLSEDATAAVLPVQSINSLIDVLPEPQCYCTLNNPPSDATFKKVTFFVLLLTLCICANTFSRNFCAGVAVVMTFFFLIVSICGCRSRLAHRIWTKSDDLKSRNSNKPHD